MGKNKFGFTLIELLVVISIIAILLALMMPNFMGIRERARDTKRKTELGEMKTALRLYYNDYQNYPTSDVATETKINGCGTDHITECPVSANYDFSAGGASSEDNVYMKKFPTMGSGSAQGWKYYSTGGDDFCLYVPLENHGDTDAATNATRCATSCGGRCDPAADGTKTYCLCAD